jgi:hypothetical protein
MSARAVGRVALIAVAIGLIAVVGEASGVAPAWAVLLGVAVSITGVPPVAPRGLTAVATGAVALLALWALAGAGLSPELAAAATAGLVVAGAGVARLRDDPRAPALAVLLGGGTVLAGAQVAGGTALAEVAPALAGLVAGLLPMQVGEIVTGLPAARDRSDARAQDRDGAATDRGRVRTVDHGGPASGLDVDTEGAGS